jgi:hypothetical protein
LNIICTCIVWIDTHSYDFSSNVREGSLGENSPESQETTFGACNACELNKWSRIFPVAEAEPIMVGSTTKVKNNAQNNEASNSDNLDGGKNKFGLSICTLSMFGD